MVFRALLLVAAVTVSGLLLLPDSAPSAPAATPASYPSCGFYWNRNAPVSAKQRRVNACIVKAARDGRRARAVAVLTTIEGDPIPNYVFVRGRRSVLVVVDTTRDAFGAQQWTRFRCKGLLTERGYLGWTGCAELGTGKPSWLKPVKLG